MDIHTVYLDMDGVLVDQLRALAYLEGITEAELLALDIRRNAQSSKPGYSHIVALIEKHLFTKRHFISANSTPEFHELFELTKFWLSKDIRVKVLSSGTAQEHLYEEICRQKGLWLDRHGMELIPRIFTKGSSDKQRYATPGCLLIDDYHRNIADFNKRGGVGILHEAPAKTFAALADLGLMP